MLFSKTLFAAFFAVAAVGVDGSPVELEKRAPNKIILCANEFDKAFWNVACTVLDYQEGVCSDITSDGLSHVKIGNGLSCTFFTDGSCTGSGYVLELGEEWHSFVGTVWDDDISSYQCRPI